MRYSANYQNNITETLPGILARCLRSAGLLLTAITILVSFSWFAIASELTESAENLEHLERKLAIAEERIEAGNLGPLSVRAVRRSVQDVLDQIEDVRSVSTTEVSRIERLLASLGPAPEDGVEDSGVQSKRAELTEALTHFEGQVKRAILIVTRAGQALSDLARESRVRFKEHILEKSVSPLSVSPWGTAIPELAGLLVHTYVEAPAQWISEISDDPERTTMALSYALISLVVAAMGWPLGRWMLVRFGRRPDIVEPSYARRLLAAFVEAVARGLIPTLFIIGVGILFSDRRLLDLELRILLDALAHYLVIFFIGYGLIRAVFTPALSAWRLTPLYTGASTRVVKRLQWVLVTYVVFGGVANSISWATPSEALESTYTFVFAIAINIALWALLRHRTWRTGDSQYEASRFWTRLRVIFTVALLTIPVSAAVGYPKLSNYLIDSSIRTGILIGGLLALRWLGRSVFNELLSSDDSAGSKLRLFLGISETTGSSQRYWIHLAFDLMLVFVAASLLLPLWGAGTEDTISSLTQLFRGIQIGSYTFSLLDFLLAATIFTVIMVATRFLQRGLERHFLPNVVRDIGVREALKTGIGYVGVVIAALVGISVLGLDLSNLALIAGALSVGLGFGLQNIVSNFVSGLILLAERPIKPGDWIIVGAHEGTVKKVNVRSTEIETFQRASVIIPNADFIANPVTNWTHKNMMGRLEVRIGVAYGSDVELVRDTLLDLAREHPMTLAEPGPAVVFRDFGGSSLDFELRCYLRDIGWVVIVGSDLRYSINQKFNELGIEIPFPQHVVHMAASTEPVPKLGPETAKSRTSTKGRKPTPDSTGGDGE